MQSPLILDGKKVSARIQAELLESCRLRTSAGQRPPMLVAVLVGHDGGSETYVAHKMKACASVGFDSKVIRLETHVSQEALLEVVDRLNQDPEVDGYLVQLPLPPHLDAQVVNLAVDPRKDVDGFHPVNVGRMALGLPCYLPATPAGILDLLRYYDLKISGMHAVVLGRSSIVGAPVASLLAKAAEPGNCTVTLCHSRTKGVADYCRQADLLVAALGKPGFVTSDMIKPGAVVIDVGTTRVADAGKASGWSLKGDVCYDEVAPLCRAITPVPGGVGPMTIASLLKNTWQAAQTSY